MHYVRHTLTVSLTDRTGERFFHICAPYWVAIIAFIIGATTMSLSGRYVSMFLMCSGYVGQYRQLPPIWCWLMDPVGHALFMAWVSNAIPRPPAKRAAAIAIVIASSKTGSMYVSGVVFLVNK